MAFWVLEEISFSAAMLFNSAPAFFASSSLRRLELEKGEGWKWADNEVSLVNNSNHLGLICEVPVPRLYYNSNT